MRTTGDRAGARNGNLPPAPPGGPATNLTAWLLEPLRTLQWCAERYGDAFTLDLGPFGPFVFVADPEVIRKTFLADPGVLRAGEPNAVLAPIIGTQSVLTSDGARHLRQRKLLLPPFHGERLEVFRERMREAASSMVERWPMDQTFAVAPEFQRLTLEVIVDLVFGVEDRQRRSKLLEVLPRMSRAATPIMFIPALARDHGPGSPARKFSRLRAEVDALIAAELRDRRACDGGGEREDILSLLLAARDESGKSLSDEELRDELMTLLFAGHETTATALAWTVDLVLHDSAVHERLVTKLADGDTEYLGAVIKEVHRLRPTVPNVVRRVHEPFELGAWTIPEGAVVSPAIYLVHRRADLYREPSAFRPDRFLNGKTPSYTWLPFGGGVRRCIGASFATLEMEEVLRAVFGRLELRAADPRPEHSKRRTVTSVPARGSRVIVEGRAA